MNYKPFPKDSLVWQEYQDKDGAYIPYSEYKKLRADALKRAIEEFEAHFSLVKVFGTPPEDTIFVKHENDTQYANPTIRDLDVSKNKISQQKMVSVPTNSGGQKWVYSDSDEYKKYTEAKKNDTITN